VEWKAPDVEGLVEFLVRDKGFKEDRVRAGAAKLTKMLAAKQQGRLDGFFTVKPKTDAGSSKKPDPKGKAVGGKRKADDKSKAGAKKKK
jgi:flap endonuclease-1